ncbi:MAG TPA: YafY family protein [Steroidobacteraceae bacterium]|jgi:predicted DNA-binding transcriptional regulator YafY|nr:YafY family protein [Steroidobacteraceae bacterium]
MTRPTQRVLTVLELLQAHGRVNGPELARRVGVDERTLRRYIAMLEELGIPIVAERGRFGGYALVAGFKLPPLMFTNDEALALAVGLLAARSLGLAEAAPAVAGAQAKLQRVMPQALKRSLRAIDETVALDLTRRNVAPEDNAALASLSAAAQLRQRVHLRYRSREERYTARNFDTYGLVWQGGRWYAVGHCHLRRDVRSFRLDRIIEVRALPASFGRPEAFDALAHLSRSVAMLPRAHSVEVLLHTDLDRARRETFDAIGVFTPEGDGVRLSASTDDVDWFARELARLSCDFEVLTPPALRNALKRHAARLRRLAGRRNAGSST